MASPAPLSPVVWIPAVLALVWLAVNIVHATREARRENRRVVPAIAKRLALIAIQFFV